MKQLQEIAITDIENVIVVPSKKGDTFQMKNRPWYGLSFCTEGEIVYRHNGKEFVSNPTVAVILPKGADYTLYRTKTGSFPLINFQCVGLDLDTFCVLPLSSLGPYLKDFKQLYEAFSIKKNRIRAIGILYGILDKLLADNSSKNNVLQPALDEIEYRFDDLNLTNKHLAQRCGISEVYFRRLFREQTGTTPKQYVLNIRLQHAKRLLSETALSVGEIAERCGFSNPYHFSRTFREQTGTTPSNYRRQMQYLGI